MSQLRPAVRVAVNCELLRAVLLCGDGVAVHAEVIHQLAKERFVVCIAGTWDLTRSAAVGRCRSRSTCVDEDSSTNELHGEGGHQLLPIEDQDESEHNRPKDSKVERTVLEVAGRAINEEDHGRPEEVVKGEHPLQQVASRPHVRLVLAASVVGSLHLRTSTLASLDQSETESALLGRRDKYFATEKPFLKESTGRHRD